jgi:PAS domain S-box-containing protein
MAAPGSVGGAKDIQRIACVGGWMLDQLTGKLTWSDEVFRLFEIPPEQFDGTYAAFLDVIHPDDRDAVNRAYTDSLATRMPYEITHRLLMPDGRIKWLHEKCETEFDAAGKALRSHGVVQDVTEHHEAMMPLRVSHETLCSILEPRSWLVL